ncbi:MAG: YsnF/AvaK domain-containing protein [Pyrinomonadaceae bacterium]
MSDSTLQAIDQNGMRGTLDLTVIPPAGSASRLVLVRFDEGSSVFVDGSAFVEQEKGVFFFPGSFAAMTINAPTDDASTEKLVIPLLAEELKIARRQVVTGGVRVHKTVSERTETVDEPLLQEEVRVEHVAVNRFVAEPPAVRYEGDVMVVPLLEEVLVIEKRLVLREEIRIFKHRGAVRRPQQVVLRREDATLEKITPESTDQSNQSNDVPGNEQNG